MIYVGDNEPGIKRLKHGKNFRYVDQGDKRDRDTPHRIRKLAIPPAYADVWFCAGADGHS